MLQITTIRPWSSTSFSGSRLTVKDCTKTLSEIKNLELPHGMIIEVKDAPNAEIEILICDNDPGEGGKTVDDLMRALRS